MATRVGDLSVCVPAGWRCGGPASSITEPGERARAVAGLAGVPGQAGDLTAPWRCLAVSLEPGERARRGLSWLAWPGRRAT